MHQQVPEGTVMHQQVPEVCLCTNRYRQAAATGFTPPAAVEPVAAAWEEAAGGAKTFLKSGKTPPGKRSLFLRTAD